MVTPDNVGLLVAFGGGIVSFLSPCVLPIVPGYLSLITGLTAGEPRDEEAAAARRSARIVVTTGLFIAGFTVVFTLLFLTTTAVSDVVFRNQETLTRVSGGFVVAMALYLAGSQLLTAPRLYGEMRFHPHLERFGPLAAPVAGAAFGLGWTPCIGPVLGSVLAVAASEGDTARGALLLVSYSAGLGVPFLVVGLALGRLTGVLAWSRRHSRGITLGSATLLGAFGVVLLLDQLPWVTARLQTALDSVGLDRLVELG